MELERFQFLLEKSLVELIGLMAGRDLLLKIAQMCHGDKAAFAAAGSQSLMNFLSQIIHVEDKEPFGS